MKVLITGIGGFVGQFLTEYLLQKNVEVWGLSLYDCDLRQEVKEKIVLRKIDITETDRLLEVIYECKPSYIIHLAAQSSVSVSWKDPQLTMKVNVIGTVNLLESVRKAGINPKILLVGSSEEYGQIKKEDIPVDESANLKPGNPYALSKLTQGILGQLYNSAYGLNTIMVRSFNHCGPGQSPTFVVSDFAKRIAEIEKGILEPVLKVGNLEAVRDFTDVRDIIRAYWLLLEKGSLGEFYNIGSGKTYNISYLLDILLRMSTVAIKIEQDPERMRPSDVPIIQCNSTKMREVTGWTPEYRIEDTLKDVLNYWRKNVEI